MTHNGQAAFRKFIKVVRVLTFLLVEIRWRFLSEGHHDDRSGVNCVYHKHTFSHSAHTGFSFSE